MNEERALLFDAITAEKKLSGRKKKKPSAKAAQLQKSLCEMLKELLALETDDAEQKKLLENLGIDPSFAGQMNFNVVQQAAKGDIEAMKYIRDTIGEKPRNGFDIGNLADKPFETVDLSSLSDAQLKALAAKKWRDRK